MQYIMTFAVSFAAALITGVPFIPFMRRLKAGQSIREDGPKWHMSKQGTPTMGGLLFIIGIGAALLIPAFTDYKNLEVFIYLYAFALLFGVIGFLDDFVKVRKKQNLGLTVLQKLLLQLAIAVLFISILRYKGIVTPDIHIPFVNYTIVLPWVGYLLFAVFAVVGIVNAVNFTDGVDGLLSSVTLPVMAFFFVCGLLLSNSGVSLFAAATAGGLAAFLIYNANPAKIFMGDTGSLFLGGVVSGLAFAVNAPLIILPVGIIYVIEMLSVVIQILYFKRTGGKRFFKMTPIHHHFELTGFSENKICAVFTLITAVLCAVALFSMAGRYMV